MNNGKLIFESYNEAIEKAYDRYFETARKKGASKDAREEREEIQALVRAAIDKWENTGIKELQGLTPAGYFSGLTDRDKLLELFKSAAVICDEELPEVFLKALEGLGGDAVDSLITLARDLSLISQKEEGFLIPLAALKVLGGWKAEKAAEPLINLMQELPGEEDIFHEAIKDALIGIGVPAVKPLIRVLSGAGWPSEKNEYLLMALSDTGRLKQSEEVYRCLKDAFLSMDNKIIGAICLGNYGDGRAVPALRSFLEKNRSLLDRETYYELKSVIERLGGNTEGL